MQAIQGVYKYGQVSLRERAPRHKSNVIVIFTDEPVPEESGMSTEEALRIFHKHAGSIKADIGGKAERLEYLDERYGCAD